MMSIIFFNKHTRVYLVWEVHIEYKCLLVAKMSPDAPDLEQELLIFVSSHDGFEKRIWGNGKCALSMTEEFPSPIILFFKRFSFNLLQFI